MADINLAQPYIDRNEGGYCDVKGDKGGETYFGIARNFNPTWNGWDKIDEWKVTNGTPRYNYIFSEEEIPTLQQDVNDFFKSTQWDKIMGDSINSQPIATYLYDFYVNAKGNAIKRLQKVIGVNVDGGFGTQTLNALNNYNGNLLLDFHNSRIAYYNEIGVGNNAKFLNGWLNRANNLYNALIP